MIGNPTTTTRVPRGGGYTSAASAMQIGGVYKSGPGGSGSESIGFRPVRTQ